MGGFRYRHLSSAAAPEGARSAWQPDSAPISLSLADSGTGVIVYIAPEWSPYDTQGENPDASPADIQTLLGIYVVADLAVAADAVASDISFSLYRGGSQIGGSIIAGWAVNSNPAFPLGVPVFVPFHVANTALRPVPSLGQNAAVTTTSALLPLQPGDCILATSETPADLVNLFAFVNAS